MEIFIYVLGGRPSRVIQYIIRCKIYIDLNYQASSGNFEKVACDNGAQELGNPVEDASEDGDLATKSQAKSDSRVDMATGDVGTNSNCNKERKSMANSNGY
jgi:hypothetical protein